MKFITLLSVLLCLFPAIAKAQDNKGSNLRERKVLKLINALPEIIASNKLRMKKDPQRPLKAYIEFTPKDKYYQVSVCDDFADRLFAYYRFKVNAVTYAIFYDDVEKGKLVPLKVWQKHPYGIYSKR